MINRLKKLLCAGLIGASLIFGSAVEAGVVTDRLPLTCYCEQRVNTYNGPGGNAVGYISANVDLIQVTQIRGDGWAYGSYPTSRGRVARWFRISDLCADVNYSNRSANVRGNQTVFRTRNGGDTLGSVSNNESVIVIADNGSRAQIVYRLDNGTGYKMGWVASSAIPSNSSNPTRNVQTGYAMLNDGWYKISPMHATNRVLDVDAASTAVGANIQLWDNNASESQPNQVFYLRNVGNNWFTLKAGHCDLNVAAANTGGSLRTNVQLASPNPNSAAQLWRLVYSSTQGAYYIESRIRDRLAFDCADTGSGNGTNIWLWEYGDVNWNKWRFTPVRPPQNNQQSSGGLKGDVNGDGQVNQSDLDQLLAYVKGQTQSINRDNSDVNGDGNINISDVSALLNRLKQNPPPTPQPTPIVNSNSLHYPLKGNINVTQWSASLPNTNIKCDYVATEGTELRAPADGEVEFRQVYSTRYNALMSYGNYIVFKTKIGNDQYEIRCAHLKSFNGVSPEITRTLTRKNGKGCGENDIDPKTGRAYKEYKNTIILGNRPFSVRQNDLLGFTGMTGNASGPHVHIEVRKNGRLVDPKSVFMTW